MAGVSPWASAGTGQCDHGQMLAELLQRAWLHVFRMERRIWTPATEDYGPQSSWESSAGMADSQGSTAKGHWGQPQPSTLQLSPLLSRAKPLCDIHRGSPGTTPEEKLGEGLPLWGNG
jgi:hypothetical protein